MPVLLVTAIGAAAAFALAALLVAALVRRDFQFWPPPTTGSWQENVFWALFRIYCGALILVAPLDPTLLAWDHWSRLALGLPLLVIGTATMLYGYGFLGLANTYGRAEGLVTGGLYAYSRNPQYVASVAAGFGWALVFASPLALAFAFGLFVLYALFALNEERWLLAQYGEAFARYCEEAPRFLDLRSVARALAHLSRARAISER
ncbi:heavy metal resistance protein CzcN [Chelativorans sp. ZYF759]|uniref:methyltransferase family protein n=1 Tax=Chelativorans sp. ZYF759 TaxID=2692213 RepID=UPI00145CB47A|nr:PEMT/PEM2 methyltransferase family protein [Chelativorans sp. ZYF759]NMG41309.1 heavy metal resistance protein CzcN [Chelativorans sp. ZYF759]